MNEGEGVRVVKGGIADLILVDPKIVVQKHAQFTVRLVQVLDVHLSQKDIVVARNGVVTGDPDAEFFVGQCDVCDECLGQVSKLAVPIVSVHPREFAVSPDAKPEREPLGVIFLAYMWKVDVAYLVFIVKVDEQSSVADGYISHRVRPGLLRLDGLFDGGIELFLNGGAKPDDLCDQLARAVKYGRLRYIAAVRKNDVRQVVLGKGDRVIDLGGCRKGRYLWPVLFAADVETDDVKVVGAVFFGQKVEVRYLTTARLAVGGPKIEYHSLADVIAQLFDLFLGVGPAHLGKRLRRGQRRPDRPPVVDRHRLL